MDYAQRHVSIRLSVTCSCMVEYHAINVIDDQLRVNGHTAFFVGAPIMRAVSLTITNAPTITIAGKGAAMIKVNVRERSAE